MRSLYYKFLFPFIYVFFLIYRHISMTSMVPLILVWVVSIPIFIKTVKAFISGEITLLTSDWTFFLLMIIFAINSLKRIYMSNYGMVWFWYYIAAYAVLLDILFLYRFYKKEFIEGLSILHVLIFASLLGGLAEHIVYKFFFHEEMWRITSVYINTFMLSTVALFFLFLPSFSKKRIYAFISIIVGMLCILFSYSRNVWAACALTLLIHFSFVYKTNRESINRELHKPRNQIVIVAIALILIGVLLTTGTFSDIVARLHVDKGGTSYQVRVGYLKYALSDLLPTFSKREILCGRGYRSSRVAIATSGIAIGYYEAFDNMYITLFYEYGLCGYAALIILLYKAFSVLKSHCKNATIIGHKDVAYCSAMICIAALVPMGFYEIIDWHSVYFLMLIAIGVVFIEYHNLQRKNNI